jgi:hypothetical protein
MKLALKWRGHPKDTRVSKAFSEHCTVVDQCGVCWHNQKQKLHAAGMHCLSTKTYKCNVCSCFIDAASYMVDTYVF